MTCTIEHLVRESVALLDENSTVQRAVDLMDDSNVGSVIVTREERVVGVFTERDLVKRVVNRGKSTADVKLKEVATTTCLVSVDHDTTCEEAVHRMKSNSCRRLLVYRGDQFIGTVNLSSVAYALAEKSRGRNILANVFVGIAVLVAVSIIILLVSILPDMLEVARITGGE